MSTSLDLIVFKALTLYYFSLKWFYTLLPNNQKKKFFTNKHFLSDIKFKKCKTKKIIVSIFNNKNRALDFFDENL